MRIKKLFILCISLLGALLGTIDDAHASGTDPLVEKALNYLREQRYAYLKDFDNPIGPRKARSPASPTCMMISFDDPAVMGDLGTDIQSLRAAGFKKTPTLNIFAHPLLIEDIVRAQQSIDIIFGYPVRELARESVTWDQ